MGVAIEKLEQQTRPLVDAIQYRGNGARGREDPFTVFLRQSQQIPVLSDRMVEIFHSEVIPGPINVLDIGTGNGRFMQRFIHRLQREYPIHFTWLEPRPENTAKLEPIGKNLPPQITAEIEGSTWQDFSPEPNTYDAIIASHVIYYFKREEFRPLFEKMIQALRPGAPLIIIAREEDEDYRFIQEFFERAKEEPFDEITIDDAVKTLQAIQNEDSSIEIQLSQVNSHIQFPFENNLGDAHSLIEFYFRVPWDEMDAGLQHDIQAYLADPQRGYWLNQVAGICVVKKGEETIRQAP